MGRAMIRLNHAEITVPRGFVAQHHGDLEAFFISVLGFERSAFPGLEESSLVFKTDPDASQFLFIAEHDAPMPRMAEDHLGFHLDSFAEVDAILTRCEAFAARDDRLEIRHFDMLDLTATTTRAFYVRYLLPIWFDIQHIAAKAGHEPTHEWRFVSTGPAS
jgi:hypothetical protein